MSHNNDITAHACTHDAPRPRRNSLFECSVAAMQDAELPPGWQPAYRAMLVKLAAMNAAGRRGLYIACPQVGQLGDLDFELSRDDRAVYGLLRKTARRLAHTCQVCGRRGKVRELSILRRAALCETCYVPAALQKQVSRLEAWATGAKVRPGPFGGKGSDPGPEATPQALLEDSLHPLMRELVPDRSWRVLQDPYLKPLGRYLDREDVLRLLPSLQAGIQQMAERTRPQARNGWR